MAEFHDLSYDPQYAYLEGMTNYKLPDGIYPVQITASKTSNGKQAGERFLNLTYVVTAGPMKDSLLSEILAVDKPANVQQQGIARGAMERICVLNNVPWPVRDDQQFVGLSYLARVENTPDGKGGQYCNIKGRDPLDPSALVDTQPPAPTQPAPAAQQPISQQAAVQQQPAPPAAQQAAAQPQPQPAPQQPAPVPATPPQGGGMPY